MGVMLLRITAPPKDIYALLRPYLLIMDQEMAPGFAKEQRIGFGEYVEELLNTDRYFETMLPRVPIPERKRFQAEFAQHLQVWRLRAAQHWSGKLAHLQPGTKLQCFSNQADWLQGEVLYIEFKRGVRSQVKCYLEDQTQESFLLCDLVLPGNGEGRLEKWDPNHTQYNYNIDEAAASMGMNAGMEEVEINPVTGAVKVVHKGDKRKRDGDDDEDRDKKRQRRLDKDLEVPRNLDWTRLRDLPGLAQRKEKMIAAYQRHVEIGSKAMPRPTTKSEAFRVGTKADADGGPRGPRLIKGFDDALVSNKLLAERKKISQLEEAEEEADGRGAQKRRMAELVAKYCADDEPKGSSGSSSRRVEVEGPERLRL